MPPNTVYVGRGTQWGNPYRVGDTVQGIATHPGSINFHQHGHPCHYITTAKEAVELYSRHLFPYQHHGERSTLENFYVSEANLSDIKASLAGKNLACWCRLDQPCHADVLLEVANG